ncbi:MAG: hypothetical protein ACI86H_001627 [bacterium]|jgi:hypothetical protein
MYILIFINNGQISPVAGKSSHVCNTSLQQLTLQNDSVNLKTDKTSLQKLKVLFDEGEYKQMKQKILHRMFPD